MGLCILIPLEGVFVNGRCNLFHYYFSSRNLRTWLITSHSQDDGMMDWTLVSSGLLTFESLFFWKEVFVNVKCNLIHYYYFWLRLEYLVHLITLSGWWNDGLSTSGLSVLAFLFLWMGMFINIVVLFITLMLLLFSAIFCYLCHHFICVFIDKMVNFFMFFFLVCFLFLIVC